jgi:hypothetical protein
MQSLKNYLKNRQGNVLFKELELCNHFQAVANYIYFKYFSEINKYSSIYFGSKNIKTNYFS